MTPDDAAANAENAGVMRVRDLPPGAGQLSLLGGDVVAFDRHADKNKKR